MIREFTVKKGIMIMLYVLFVLLGLIVYITINHFKLKRIIAKNDCFLIDIITFISLVIGCKLLDIIVNYKYYLIFNFEFFLRYGYMFYGGIILLIVYIHLYCYVKRIDCIKVFQIILPNVLILYSICKLGCFFNGCCSGNLVISLPLIESILFGIIYLIYVKYCNKNKGIYYFLIIFSSLRGISFFFRKDLDTLNLISNELISFIFLFYGLRLLVVKREIIKKIL